MVRDTEVAVRERTISPEAWSRAVYDRPVTKGEMNGVVNKCMAELLQKPTAPLMPSYGFWRGVESRFGGVMSSGVSHYPASYSKGEGLLLMESSLSETRIRLSPAEEGAEVQYGFCPIKLHTFRDVVVNILGEARAANKIPEFLFVGNRFGSLFRVDKVIQAACSLGSSKISGESGIRFRKMVREENLTFSDLMKELLKDLYGDKRNVCEGKSPRYRAIVYCILKEAYGDFLDIDNSLERGKTAISRYFQTKIPYEEDDYPPTSHKVYNVIMPKPIFEAIIKVVEAEKNPIIPLYFDSAHWMFNGGVSDPCPGIEMERGMDWALWEVKVLGAAINCFNQDLSGGVSIWNPSWNPEEKWVDTFVSQLEHLSTERIPLYRDEQRDLSLMYSRRIPTVFVGENQGAKYSRVVDWIRGRNREYISSVSIRECDATGSKFIGAVVVKGPPPPQPYEEVSEDEEEFRNGCSQCGTINDTVSTQTCGHEACEDCSLGCPGGCDSDSCCEDCESTHFIDSNCGPEREA